MKTNTVQIITTAVLTGLFAGFGSTTVTGNFFTGVAVAVSSWAAIALVAITVADYRFTPKGYRSGAIATGHFGQVMAPSVVVSTPPMKARLAA